MTLTSPSRDPVDEGFPLHGGYCVVGFMVFVGAGLGGLTRYAIGSWFQPHEGSFPWSTLVINVTGSLLLTLMYGSLQGLSAAPEWRAFLGIGVLGGFTTFSAFSYEALRLLQHGEWQRALLYVIASVLLSLAGAALGFHLALALLGRE